MTNVKTPFTTKDRRLEVLFVQINKYYRKVFIKIKRPLNLDNRQGKADRSFKVIYLNKCFIIKYITFYFYKVKQTLKVLIIIKYSLLNEKR